MVGIADVSNTLFGPSFSSELVTVINDVNNRLVRNSGVSHRTLASIMRAGKKRRQQDLNLRPETGTDTELRLIENSSLSL